MPIVARTDFGTPSPRSRCLWLAVCGAFLSIGSVTVAHAQAGNSISQPVVQPLPSPGVSRLNAALKRLSRNSRDVGALIEAGEASLEVNDVDAAIGFFDRAQDLASDDPNAKAGLAAAYARKQRPLEALKLFDEAQAAGASAMSHAGDRALAYDLVGDNNAAMGFYRQALGQQEDSATRRRFALSHAISGDRRAFEAVLAPLIKQRDPASYRTRAFGLAILGEADDAIAITEAVMPRNMSSRMAPYLRYMSRLTNAQQAAAANFGTFPRAAQIGRDTPQIASYTGSNAAARNAGARLAPQGEPLGRRADSTSQRRRPDRGRSTVDPAPVAQVTDADIRQAARANRAAASDPMSRAVAPRRVRVKRNPDAAKPEALIEVPEPKQAVIQETAESRPAETIVATRAKPTVVQPANPAQPSVAALTDGAFDLAKVSDAPTPKAVEPDVAVAEPETVPVAEKASVADAFANFATPPSETASKVGGVDITKITPPREIAKKPEAEPKKPEHPKRFWVQVATGKDRQALKFDWRRISRKAPEILGDLSPRVAAWGQTYRLLAGPYSSAKAARSAMNSLQESDIDSFTFTSAEGQEIEQP